MFSQKFAALWSHIVNTEFSKYFYQIIFCSWHLEKNMYHNKIYSRNKFYVLKIAILKTDIVCYEFRDQALV